ncbi:MAG: hypothetical protein JW820_02645 [Spirochaetales bacterium]|nr:hypothetical protein [Spirochaetales bacterium]
MKKRVLLSLVLIPVLLGGLATAVFAGGQSEEPAPPAEAPEPWQGRGYDERPAPSFSEESVTVTGRLYFDNRIHPELISEGKEYELLVPRHYLYEAELKEGQTVTVVGYTVTGLPRFEDQEGAEGEEVHLWVTRAVIDGKEYDLERYARGPMGGPRWAPRGRGRMGMRGAPYGMGPCGPDAWGPGWGEGPWWPRRAPGPQGRQGR